ncbi:MAG TPA: hypothetical protein GXX46_02630 [Peptococcaceae bacterium]|nr:hypothetical protein [Peptococcaceae bacterium]
MIPYLIQDVAHNQLATELLQKDAKIIGSKVLTTKGSLIGEVKEIMIDEESGKIIACQVLSPEGTTSEVKCEGVVTYGKEIILIDDSFLSGKHIQSENRRKPAVSKQAGLNEKELLRKKIEEISKGDDTLLNVAKTKVQPISSGNTMVNNSESNWNEIFNVFEQRQLEFLVGKTLEKDVLLDNGQLLKAGEEITKELLATVKTRSTLMQLTAHVVK